MVEPVPVIPLEYAKPAAPASRTWRTIVLVCHLLALSCCVIAWLLILLVDVESVIGTGPALFALGLLLIIGGAIVRSGVALGFGAAHVAICLLFFGLVNLLDWSPGDAEGPFEAIGGAYTATALIAAALLRSRMFHGRLTG